MSWRRSLGALLIALWPAFASAQITLVSGQSNTSVSGTMWTGGSPDETLAFPSPVTSGNTVVAWTSWAHSGRTMACVHDGNAMTAVVLKGATSADGDAAFQAFARVATTTGQGVVCTISGADNNTNQGFTIAEFAGVAAVLSTSGGAGVSATTSAQFAAATSLDSGADLTPDTANNLFLGGVMVDTAPPGPWTDDTFTMLQSGNNVRHGYKIQSAATANDWVPTTTNPATGEIGLVNLDGAAGGGATRFDCGLLLLGVGRACP